MTWNIVPALASESLSGPSSAKCADVAEGDGGMLMREWGRYLEDELVGVQMVIMNALTSGSIHLPTSSVRGRDAQPDLFATLEQAEAVVDSGWSPVIAFYIRQVPALRFDTLHGSVVVTDLWGETKYRPLRGVKARPALRIHAPLMAVAERVDAMRYMRGVHPSGTAGRGGRVHA